MFWLEETLILSNVLIRGESNFDDKYVEKSAPLVRSSSFRNDLLQNPYFSTLILNRVSWLAGLFTKLAFGDQLSNPMC